MFVLSGTVKVLLREIASLRRELRRRDRVILELIDKYTHNRVPQRLVGPKTEHQPNSDFVISDTPSDAYSLAIEDARRRAETLQPILMTTTDEDDD